MLNPNFVLLYVESPLKSADFYENLLGTPPVDRAPTFSMFALPSGIMLGLWAKAGVQPPATSGGGSELAFTAEGKAAVDKTFVDWKAKGVHIIQPPVQMDFGYTFTAMDPDGHRLRVFAPG